MATSDLVRFAAVAILVFLICAVIGVALLNPSDLGLGTETAQVEEPNDSMVDPAAEVAEEGGQTVGVAEEESAADTEKERKRRKQRDKALKKKKWKEPIDLFDEPVDESAPEGDQKIVIERGVKE